MYMLFDEKENEREKNTNEGDLREYIARESTINTAEASHGTNKRSELHLLEPRVLGWPGPPTTSEEG